MCGKERFEGSIFRFDCFAHRRLAVTEFPHQLNDGGASELTVGSVRYHEIDEPKIDGVSAAGDPGGVPGQSARG